MVRSPTSRPSLVASNFTLEECKACSIALIFPLPTETPSHSVRACWPARSLITSVSSIDCCSKATASSYLAFLIPPVNNGMVNCTPTLTA